MGNLIKRLRKIYGAIDKFEIANEAADRIEELQAQLAEIAVCAYIQGYESGHHDTVEGMFYGSDEDAAKEWYADYLREKQDE